MYLFHRNVFFHRKKLITHVSACSIYVHVEDVCSISIIVIYIPHANMPKYGRRIIKDAKLKQFQIKHLLATFSTCSLRCETINHVTMSSWYFLGNYMSKILGKPSFSKLSMLYIFIYVYMYFNAWLMNTLVLLDRVSTWRVTTYMNNAQNKDQHGYKNTFQMFPFIKTTGFI